MLHYGIKKLIYLVCLTGEAGERVQGFSWWYILLIILVTIAVIAIFILVFTFRNYHEKHGQYSFTPVETNEAIPLSNRSPAGNA